MDIAAAAQELNNVAYGYISSWAVLTASKRRLFDRLPASPADLGDEYPDPALVDTWMRVLETADLVRREGDVWHPTEAAQALLVGDDSYANYLGGQILDQLVPLLTSGAPSNQLEDVLVNPGERSGYEGWFADAGEAEQYQASQYAGSLLPGRTMARMLEPQGRVLDLGGGWGAVARAVADRHEVSVDVVDLDPVVDAAPPASDAVVFEAGNALDPDTWPEREYDGAILSYLFSSVPGELHQGVLDALADRGLRWTAIHDFMIDGGDLAPAWSLQHAVFVPGHVSRSVDDVSNMLAGAGFAQIDRSQVVAEMTTMVVGHAA